ncbi:MAG: 7-cyano-7-deazaguanine synthase QueC [Armatimonadetes bacterium]|nr:7-cyano-7-deazaguanine synthase QueC [Armatimonadota bacterium]
MSYDPAAPPEGDSSAVLLLSGGLDSYTAGGIARERGLELYALSFDYGQRHDREVKSAARVASDLGVKEHLTLELDLRKWGGSALTDKIAVPTGRDEGEMAESIPSTYVPARNIIFLSLALGYAEARGARAILAGMNQLDYSGYPDCRAEFLQAFEEMANRGTKAGVEGEGFRIWAPLVHMTKAEIVREGMRLGLDYGLTWSCYLGGETPCGACDSCILRAKGFMEAGVPDSLTS